MKTVYTVHVNGVARYHGVRKEDASDIAWVNLLNGDTVEVQHACSELLIGEICPICDPQSEDES